MNNDLDLGERDGTYKNITPDRGGLVEESDPKSRYQDLQAQYNVTDIRRGIHGKSCTCPQCSPIPGSIFWFSIESYDSQLTHNKVLN